METVRRNLQQSLFGCQWRGVRYKLGQAIDLCYCKKIEFFFLKALLHTSNDVFQISWKPRLGYCNFFLSIIIIIFLKNEKYNFYDGDFLLATIQVLRKKYWKFVLRFLD